MQPEHLLTFASMFAATWALGATTAALSSSNGTKLRTAAYAAVGLSMMLFVVWLGSLVSLGRNSVVFLFEQLLSADPEHLCAAALGVCVGFAPAIWPWQSGWIAPAGRLPTAGRRIAFVASTMLAFVFVALLALQEELKPYLVHRSLGSIVSNPLSQSIESGFVVEKYHDCDFRPVQIAIGPEGDLHATGYRGDVNQYGIVVRIQRDPQSGITSEVQIAQHLNRPHGLAFLNGELYVSRSGNYSRAHLGNLTHEDTGAVTLLRDTDNDGIMDYYHDVVPNLPGAQGPDELHQNNGIAFGPNGTLYITAGAHSDRAPTVGQYEGTVLRCRADGSELAVMAEGFRNPFDIAVGPDGELFCTDNDAMDRRNGDELNHVTAGGHYGYPYADGSHPHPEGSVAPILVQKRGTLQGLVFVDADTPGLPLEFRDCFYAVSYGNGEVLRIVLKKSGETYAATSTVFARIPNALDITVGPDGTLYVSCFHGKAIYRIRFRGESA